MQHLQMDELAVISVKELGLKWILVIALTEERKQTAGLEENLAPE